MNPDRFDRVKEILLRVADLPETERRAAVDEACGGDPGLRADVEDLLDRGLRREAIVDNREKGCVWGEEVTSADLLGVVPNEGVSCLGLAGTIGAPDHVATDRARGVVESELGIELLGDLVFAPLWMVAGDAPDEGDVLPGDSGTTDLTGGRTPAPEQLEALAVPGDYGLPLQGTRRV